MAAIRSRLPESDWDKILFEDQYRGGGYGERKEEVSAVIRQMMEQNGIPMDSTYTGKAFWGMTRVAEEQERSPVHGYCFFTQEERRCILTSCIARMAGSDRSYDYVD